MTATHGDKRVATECFAVRPLLVYTFPDWATVYKQRHSIMTSYRSTHSPSEQRRLERPLPCILPVLKNTDLDMQCRGGIACASTGNDLFDAVQTTPERMLLLLMTMAPHSKNPLHLLAVAQSVFRSRTRELFPSNAIPDPTEALKQMAASLSLALDTASASDYYATAILGSYDTATAQLHYISAGAPHILIKRGLAVDEIHSDGTPLGKSTSPSERNLDQVHLRTIDPGTAFVFVTPGVLEARSHHAEFGIKKLSTVVAEHAADTAHDVCHAVISAAIQFEQQPGRYGPPLTIPGFRQEAKPHDMTAVALLRLG